MTEADFDRKTGEIERSFSKGAAIFVLPINSEVLEIRLLGGNSGAFSAEFLDDLNYGCFFAFAGAPDSVIETWGSRNGLKEEALAPLVNRVDQLTRLSAMKENWESWSSGIVGRLREPCADVINAGTKTEFLIAFESVVPNHSRSADNPHQRLLSRLTISEAKWLISWLNDLVKSAERTK